MEQRKIVYISGAISGKENYKDDFSKAEKFLTDHGYIAINPARLDEICKDLTWEEYLQICYRLVDISDSIFMISSWQKSKGANAELCYAKSLGKKVMYQDYYYPFRKVGTCNDEKSTERIIE